MRVTIDTETKEVVVAGEGGEERHELFSKEAFDVVADLWVRLGWVANIPTDSPGSGGRSSSCPTT
jgi:hypothetical protein